jgi:maltose O-acetyltransferase
MLGEKEKMLAGELYDPLDPELVKARNRARDLCQELNSSRESEQEFRRRILMKLFGRGGDSVWMQPPFYCDYGSNILLGQRIFFNFNCVVLDVCQVKIGDFTQFGPAVQIYTATHPMNAELRRKQEFGKPVEIGSDVVGWWRSNYLPWRQNRLELSNRCRKRRYEGCPRRRIRCGESMPGDPSDHRIS